MNKPNEALDKILLAHAKDSRSAVIIPNDKSRIEAIEVARKRANTKIKAWALQELEDLMDATEKGAITNRKYKFMEELRNNARKHFGNEEGE